MFKSTIKIIHSESLLHCRPMWPTSSRGTSMTWLALQKMDYETGSNCLFHKVLRIDCLKDMSLSLAQNWVWHWSVSVTKYVDQGRSITFNWWMVLHWEIGMEVTQLESVFSVTLKQTVANVDFFFFLIFFTIIYFHFFYYISINIFLLLSYNIKCFQL